MTCNDILTRLRYTFDYSDAEMVKIFAAADHTATEDQVRSWVAGQDSPQHEPLEDRVLASFLNGFINHRRGKRPGDQPEPESRLNNNLIAKKLKIALNLKSQDVIMLLSLAEFDLSNHELSAFFRKPGHKHYRQMNDQILRNFLRGLQLEIRP